MAEGSYGERKTREIMERLAARKRRRSRTLSVDMEVEEGGGGVEPVDMEVGEGGDGVCLLYTSPSPRDS